MYGCINEYRDLHDWRPFHHLLGLALSMMLTLLRILDGWCYKVFALVVDDFDYQYFFRQHQLRPFIVVSSLTCSCVCVPLPLALTVCRPSHTSPCVMSFVPPSPLRDRIQFRHHISRPNSCLLQQDVNVSKI
ncbi:hypothetical protein EDD85DRAFT_599565 [Armillaria nabsnona]|nr:hypothetical protein EDD85DRAFT_599565 [Armillaria nabsnona]